MDSNSIKDEVVLERLDQYWTKLIKDSKTGPGLVGRLVISESDIFPEISEAQPTVASESVSTLVKKRARSYVQTKKKGSKKFSTSVRSKSPSLTVTTKKKQQLGGGDKEKKKEIKRETAKLAEAAEAFAVRAEELVAAAKQRPKLFEYSREQVENALAQAREARIKAEEAKEAKRESNELGTIRAVDDFTAHKGKAEDARREAEAAFNLVNQYLSEAEINLATAQAAAANTESKKTQKKAKKLLESAIYQDRLRRMALKAEGEVQYNDGLSLHTTLGGTNMYKSHVELFNHYFRKFLDSKFIADVEKFRRDLQEAVNEQLKPKGPAYRVEFGTQKGETLGNPGLCVFNFFDDSVVGSGGSGKGDLRSGSMFHLSIHQLSERHNPRKKTLGLVHLVSDDRTQSTQKHLWKNHVRLTLKPEMHKTPEGTVAILAVESTHEPEIPPGQPAMSESGLNRNVRIPPPARQTLKKNEKTRIMEVGVTVARVFSEYVESIAPLNVKEIPRRETGTGDTLVAQNEMLPAKTETYGEEGVAREEDVAREEEEEREEDVESVASVESVAREGPREGPREGASVASVATKKKTKKRAKKKK